eukprot:3538869-Amphidinium_carterae.1
MGRSLLTLDDETKRAGWAAVSMNEDGSTRQVRYASVPPQASHTQSSREDMALAMVLGEADENQVRFKILHTGDKEHDP